MHPLELFTINFNILLSSFLLKILKFGPKNQLVF